MPKQISEISASSWFCYKETRNCVYTTYTSESDNEWN